MIFFCIQIVGRDIEKKFNYLPPNMVQSVRFQSVTPKETWFF